MINNVLPSGLLNITSCILLHAHLSSGVNDHTDSNKCILHAYISQWSEGQLKGACLQSVCQVLNSRELVDEHMAVAAVLCRATGVEEPHTHANTYTS